ncbi:hypothetical protein GCM10029978_103930 [Actinoallomurus acanthiterrae]
MNDPAERFTALYDRYYRNVLGYVLLRAEHGAAEDVVSEVFLIAWRRLDDLPESPLPWLLGVARNLLFKQYDVVRRRQVLTDRLAEAAGDQDLTGLDVAEQVVERDAAKALLTELGEKDVEALVLASWYGLTPRQAARVLGCTAATFTVRLHRARKRLAKAASAASSRGRPAAPGRMALINEEAR